VHRKFKNELGKQRSGVDVLFRLGVAQPIVTTKGRSGDPFLWRKPVFDDALNDFPIRAGGPQARPPSESFDKGNNAFARLPHVAARDHRLTEIELVLLAYRLTFADDKSAYALNEKRLLKERRAGRIVSGRGFGKNAIRKAISGLKAKGYLHRGQDKSRPDGKWGRARENLTPLARDCGATGNAGQHIRREWFDGSLTLNELAAILFVRAGNGKGPAHLRELAARFHWCRQTAELVIRGLLERGLLAKHVARASDGTLVSTTYAAAKPDARRGATDKMLGVGKPGVGKRSVGKAGNIRSGPPHGPPLEHYPEHIEEAAARTEKLHLAPMAQSATAQECDSTQEEAFGSSIILGWLVDDTRAHAGAWSEDILNEVSSEALQRVSAVESDAGLAALLNEATGGRVHRDIRSPAGLYGVRLLAAYLLSKHQETTPAEALASVLQAVRDRIGNREGASLNSLALIGERIGAASYAERAKAMRRYYVPGDKPVSRAGRAKTAPPPRDAALAELIQADGARVLARKLRNNPGGLNKLLKKYGAEALDTIKEILLRAMIDGGRIGKVKSWSCFEGPLKQAHCAAEMEALGLKPGDLFCAHGAWGASQA
jgi:hypothetical protein